jgi:hypothetical protein
MVRNDCSADTRLLEKTDFLEKVVTDDEMWVFQCDREIKCQYVEYSLKDQKSVNVKIMLPCSTDIKGIIRYKFVPPNVQSTKHFIYKLWNVYGCAFIEKRPNLCCIMTMHFRRSDL